jgi:hypothetical protein
MDIASDYPEVTKDVTFSLSSFVGDQFVITNSLEGGGAFAGSRAHAATQGGFSATQVLLDATNTGRFSLVANTPGATYITESGVSYVAAVPEPDTYALLLAGLGALAVMLKRRGAAKAL